MRSKLFGKRKNAIIATVLSVALIMCNQMAVCAEEVSDIDIIMPSSESSYETVNESVNESTDMIDGSSVDDSDYDVINTEVDDDSNKKESDVSENEFNSESKAEDSIEPSERLASIAKYTETLDEGKDYVENEIIFYADSESEAESIAHEYGGTLLSFRNGLAKVYVSGGVIGSFDAAIASNVSTVAYPNYIRYICTGKTIKLEDVPSFKKKDNFNSGVSPKTVNDPYINNGWQWYHKAVHSLEAQTLGYTGKGVVVAVLDTGISLNHKEFKGRIRNTSSYYNNDSAEDDNGHGSHCAGLIGASANNSEGGAGIAPDVIFDIHKVCNYNGQCMDYDVADAIDNAVKDGVDVISMSFGGYNNNSILEESIRRAYNSGITCVAAAGNESYGYAACPACYNQVISVGASAYLNSDALAEYSNYGREIDVVAPGGAGTYKSVIRLSQNGITEADIDKYSKEAILSTYKNEGYALLSGTSMATPIVSGIVALLYQKYRNVLRHNSSDCDMMKNIIIDSTDGQIYSSIYGSVENGMVLADKAVLNDDYRSADNNVYYNFQIMDETLNMGTKINTYVMAGKSINLYIVDDYYTPTLLKIPSSIKKMSKKANWSCDSPYLKVKGGKIKCAKNAPVGTVIPVTAEYEGTTVTANVMVLSPVYKIGNCVSGNNFSSKNDITINLYTGIPMYEPDTIFKNAGLELAALHMPKKSNVGYTNTKDFSYLVKIANKYVKKDMVYMYDNNLYFTKPGKYKIQYKLLYGCNKKFNINVTVKDNGYSDSYD